MKPEEPNSERTSVLESPITEEPLRRLSLDQAAARVKDLSIAFAQTQGIEGFFIEAKPDNFCHERIGKVPIHWVAFFESKLNGKNFESPIIFQVDLVAKSVVIFPSL